MSDESANTQQATYWTDTGGPYWVEQQKIFDHMLSAYGTEGIRTLDAQVGEYVLDVGCGTATTTLAIGEQVGPSGHVRGCDISSTMIAAARARGASMPQVSFAVADAQTDRLVTDQPFDAVFSRFGVMFFDDPITAFTNIGTQVRSGARLTFVCWQAPERNECISLPEKVIRQFTTDPVVLPLDAPGPFAFRDETRIVGILRDAGWTEIDVVPFEAPTVMGGPGGLEGAVRHAMSSRAGQALRSQGDDSAFTAAREAVRIVLSEHLVDGNVVFSGNVWIASARRP